MRGRRVARGIAIGVVCYLVLRMVAGVGSGGGDSGSYALLHPGYAYPCAPIHYTVSSAEAPPDFADVVHGAVGRVSAASGYRFYFDGMTSDRNFFENRVAGPVLIGFAATGENVQLSGDAIGLGGSAWNTATGRYVTGAIELDATQYAHETDPAERQAIVMHELGHVLGLDHAEDRDEVMFPVVSATSFGPGDLAGLRHQYELSCPGGQS